MKHQLTKKEWEFTRNIMKKMCLDENMTTKGMIVSSDELDNLHTILEKVIYEDTKEME